MTTTNISTIDAKEDFSELINRVSHNKERIILTRRDKEVAALICMEDFVLLQSVESQSDLHDAVESLKDLRQHGAITLEKLNEEIG